MAITRQRKTEFLDQYQQNLEDSTAIFLTEYQGLSVNQLSELRNLLRGVNSSYRVVKNTLAIRALNEIGINGVEDLFEGPVGVSFCFGEPPEVAKVLLEFEDKSQLFKIKAGFLGGSQIDPDGIEALTKLPTIEVLRAQILGLINAPATQMVSILPAPATQLAGVMNSAVRQVINVVNAYAISEE